MSTNLEKGKKQRLKVTQYYSSASEFIIRLLMGLGIYIVVRIVLMALLTKSVGIAFTFCDSLVELSVLIITAVLMILFIWLKGTRFHLAAAVWMPAIACLAFADLVRMFMIFMQPYSIDAWLGYLPFVLPLVILIVYWILDPEKLWLRLISTLVFTAMLVFWITDIPKSIQEARDVQEVIGSYQEFDLHLKEFHQVAWADAPESLLSGNVLSLWHTKEVDPNDYRIDREIPAIIKMYYVVEADIIISALKDGLRVSSQELTFSSLDHVSLHYFYKYSTERKIVIKDFQYTGDAFFLLELENGEKLIVDNVLIRKNDKESEAS
jgi:hypothetical protein